MGPDNSFKETVETLELPAGVSVDGIVTAAIEVDPQQAPPQSAADIWTRITSGMNFSAQVPDTRVQTYLDWYSSNQTYIDRVGARANRYLFHIVEELERNNMPTELALLPVVESAFNPFAYSHSSAAGLWQFIPETGRHYGLRQDWWYEGRRDVVDSTAAAIAYLGYLNNYFDGDWLLALAAYNSGEGNVRKAIAKNRRAGKRTDFWSLSLPKETRAYVPQLIALAKIVANPEKFSINLPSVPNRQYFAQVELDEQIDLAEAAKLAGISVEEMYLLNPGHNRWVTPPAGHNRLLLPVDCAQTFTEILATIPRKDLRPELPYVVKPGDTLSQIARRHNVQVADLRARNKISRDMIKPGQVLNIIGRGTDRPLPFEQAAQRYYKVRNGDSLWKIAKKMNVSVKDLIRWNRLDSRSLIRPGQTLAVRGDTRATRKAKPSAVIASNSRTQDTSSRQHAVSRGDSLYTIARRYDVQINDLLRWNGIQRSDYLQPGQILKLYTR